MMVSGSGGIEVGGEHVFRFVLSSWKIFSFRFGIKTVCVFSTRIHIVYLR